MQTHLSLERSDVGALLGRDREAVLLDVVQGLVEDKVELDLVLGNSQRGNEEALLERQLQLLLRMRALCVLFPLEHGVSDLFTCWM